MIASAALSAAALAQTPPSEPAKPEERSPQNDPALTDPSVDEAILEQQKRRKPSPVVEPTPPRPPMQPVPGVPGVNTLDFSMPEARYYPEGTFLSAVPGRLVRADGETIFLPDAAKSGSGAPMLLLPCNTLAQLLGASGAAAPKARVALSGQVFTYRDRQYLLPTVFAMAPVDATSPATPEPGNEATPDPRVEELLRGLETRRDAPRATEPPRAQARDNAQALVGEGTLVVNRRARLVRSGEGRFEVAFDNDPNSPAPPRMPLLPCRLLERVESVAAARGEDVAFAVSGRVMVFQGKNYLLPTLMQTMPRLGVEPRQ